MTSVVPVTAFSRAEFIDQIPFVANSTQTLRSGGGLLPSDRFYSGILVEFRGRLTQPAANPCTTVSADWRSAIIERIVIEGYHRLRGKQEKFIDLRGEDIRLLQQFYCPSPLIQLPTTLATAANDVNDITFQLFIPFTPARMPQSTQSMYLLDAPNYDSLKLSVQFGDYLSVVSGAAGVSTWSAFGSAAGTPEVRVSGYFAINPTRFRSFVPGRVWRYFTEISGSLMTTTQTGTRLYDLPRGYDLRSVMLKTGIKSVATTAGNNVFASLSDANLANIAVNLGLGKPIRRYHDMGSIYADVATAYNLAGNVAGVKLVDFAQYGNIGEVLQTRSLIAGATGNTDLYLSADVTGAVNQSLIVCVEELRDRPTFAR